MPGDTIRIAQNVGIIHRVQFRPSIRRQFLTRESLLSPQEVELLWKFNNNNRDTAMLNGLSETSKAHVMDAAIDLMDLQHSHELIDEKAPIKKVKDRLLVERSRLPITEPLVIQAPKDEEPHTAHPSARVGLGGSRLMPENQALRDSEFLHLSYRAALHDLVDPLKGYLKYSRTEMGNLDLRYNSSESRLQVQNASLLALDSLAPLSNYNSKSAWRLGLGMDRRTDKLCNDCLRSEFEFGMGYAYSPHGIVNAYGLMMAKGSYASGYSQQEVAGHVGPVLGLNAHLGENFGLQAEWSWSYNWHQNQDYDMSEGKVLARYFVSPGWALDASYSVNPYAETLATTLFHYY